jgi:hypothetical protein
MILPKYLTQEHIGDLKTIFNSSPFDLLRVDYNRMPLELDEEGNPKLVKRHLKVEIVNNAVETSFLVEPIEETNYSKYAYNPDDMCGFIGIRCVMGIDKAHKIFSTDANVDRGDGVTLGQQALEDMFSFNRIPRVIELETLDKEHKENIKNFYKYFYETKKLLQEHGRI